VALSLHRLHRESRLRHGDVTLRNVLLGRDGRAYLADMGVAEHNHPYGRQPQQEGQGKDYSSSVAPEMVQGVEGSIVIGREGGRVELGRAAACAADAVDGHGQGEERVGVPDHDGDRAVVGRGGSAVGGRGASEGE
jgi:hypothetical protein